MKQLRCILIGLLCSSTSFADVTLAPLTLDKINFQLSAKTWVSAQTVLVTVQVNASLNAADVVKARSDILEKLAKIAPGTWHIIQFDRFQDSSGLDKLAAVAQARIEQNQLTHLYDKAKNVSKPGETYLISTIEFKPDLQEIEKAKTELRQTLNHLVAQELNQLNQLYTEQHFTVNQMTYQEDAGLQARQGSPVLMMATGTAARVQQSTGSTPLVVSNELLMTALVEAGSVRK